MPKLSKESSKNSNSSNDSVKSSPKAGISSDIESSLEQSLVDVQSNDIGLESDDSNSEDSSDEIKENWTCPWKIQHKRIIITQFNNPNQFYITQRSEE